MRSGATALVVVDATGATAAFAFGGKERLEASASGLLIHADAAIDDLDLNGPSVRRDSGSQRQWAAVGHSVDRIEDQVNERLSNFIVSAHDRRQVRRQVGVYLDDDTSLLRHVAPTGARQIHDLLHQSVHAHGKRGQLRFSLAIEFAHACNGSCYIINGTLDRFELAASAWTEVGLLLQQ